MKSSINVRYNVYARNSFELRHTDHLSTRITVQTAAHRKLTRADAFTRSHEH